ncbi:MAG: flagellin FliC [Cyanobacteria bacterium]|nr:flagellin FliC [Cyanobacteriota bacterium]
MPITINTNASSLNAQRHLSINGNNLSRSLERLSSGLRINRAGDDAAGLQISELFRAQIRGTSKAADNTQDGINLLNLADGAYQTITDNLQRVRELTVQAANDANATAQRTAIENEIDQLRNDVDRIASATSFNGVNLLGSSVPANFYIQVGANANNALDRIDISSGLGNTSTTASGINLSAATGQFTDNSAIQSYITKVDTALSALLTKRATLGAFTNRLQSSLANVQISNENFSAAEARIRNVDVAAESANLTRNQILQQASASILTQANQIPQLALKLLGN